MVIFKGATRAVTLSANQIHWLGISLFWLAFLLPRGPFQTWSDHRKFGSICRSFGQISHPYLVYFAGVGWGRGPIYILDYKRGGRGPNWPMIDYQIFSANIIRPEKISIGVVGVGLWQFPHAPKCISTQQVRFCFVEAMKLQVKNYFCPFKTINGVPQYIVTLL